MLCDYSIVVISHYCGKREALSVCNDRRMRITIVSVFALVGLLAGCGDSTTKTTTKASTTRAGQVARTTTTAADAKPKLTAVDRAGQALVLSKGNVAFANYCVHVTGAKIGQSASPSSAEKARVELAIRNLSYTARDYDVTEKFGGRTVAQWLQKGEELLALCDQRRAARVQGIADRALG